MREQSFIQTLAVFLIVTLPGWVILLAFGESAGLRCERLAASQPVCQRQATWYGLLVLDEQALPGLQSAYVDADCDGERCDYRVGLQSETRLPLNAGSSGWSHSRPPKQAVVDQINRFLQDPAAPSLRVRDSLDPLDLALVIGISGLWIALGGWMTLGPLAGKRARRA